MARRQFVSMTILLISKEGMVFSNVHLKCVQWLPRWVCLRPKADQLPSELVWHKNQQANPSVHSSCFHYHNNWTSQANAIVLGSMWFVLLTWFSIVSFCKNTKQRSFPQDEEKNIIFASVNINNYERGRKDYPQYWRIHSCEVLMLLERSLSKLRRNMEYSPPFIEMNRTWKYLSNLEH